MSAPDATYAPADVRDRFLNALDANDRELCQRLAAELRSCMNPFPGIACGQLGLPIGSTYGSAARQILGTAEDPG